MTAYEVPDGPKMLRETLCIAQALIGNATFPFTREWKRTHVDRLQRLINACDGHRPLGPDGKHGDRHTATCGCEVAGRGCSQHTGDLTRDGEWIGCHSLCPGAERPIEGCPYCSTGLADHCPYHDRTDGSQ